MADYYAILEEDKLAEKLAEDEALDRALYFDALQGADNEWVDFI